MAITGTFHIEDSFNITGRGLTVFGDLTSGKVNIGDYLTFDAGQRRLP
jgi:translation elongation factor EF-Tu-like GTPase